MIIEWTNADLARRRALRRMRTVATGLLLLALAIYIATHGREGAWGYVNAAAEAGMVGAIADWFAVTALFRHPLGLPIPHTAIIPRKKVALGRSLEEFVSAHFLTTDLVRQRYLQAGVARRVAQWVAAPGSAERVVGEAAPLIARGLNAVDSEDVAAVVTGTVVPQIEKQPSSAVLGHVLQAVVADRAHHGAVDVVVTELRGWVHGHRGEIEELLRTRAPWWSPSWVDDRVVGRVYAELVGWIDQVEADRDHPARRALDSYLATLAEDMQRDPQVAAQVDRLVSRLLRHPEVGPTTIAVWEAVRAVLVEALADPEGQLRTRAVHLVRDAAARVVADEPLAARIDTYGADAVAALVTRYGPELTSVISSTIEQWDGRQAAARIELHVGRDLQFIRINGTVVGALVGLGLHTIAQWW